MADGTLHLTLEVAGNYKPTLLDLERWYGENERGRKRTYTKICNLGEVLKGGEDPMEFLTRMYEKGGSLDVIMSSPEVGSVDFVSRATLHRLLFKHLDWKPRSNTDRTPVHEDQLHQKTQREIRLFEESVANLLGGREVKREFDIDEFNDKRHRIGKALYILKTIGGIDKNILFETSKEAGISDAVIAHGLNKQLRDIIIYAKAYDDYGVDFDAYGILYEDVEVYPQSIRRWFVWNQEKESTQSNDE